MDTLPDSVEQPLVACGSRECCADYFAGLIGPYRARVAALQKTIAILSLENRTLRAMASEDALAVLKNLDKPAQEDQ